MSAFADALAVTREAKRALCNTCLLLDRLDKDDRADLEDAFADRRFTSIQIAVALRSLGHEISNSSVQRHRRGGCRERS